MDIRRLHAFMKIVDIGSITRASVMLHVAQPALSQQIAALETHFGKPLLLRSKRGVVPTEAGRVLYRHCQQILKQMDQAQLDIMNSSEELTGAVTVGLAPLGLGALLAVQLIKEVRELHPGIVLHVNENVGGVISEQIMTGKMDMALIFDPGGIPGVQFDPVQTEELHYVSTRDDLGEGTEILFAQAAARPLILPGRIHTIRQVIDTTLNRAGLSAQVVAETESIGLIIGAMLEGLGDSILPLSAAKAVVRRVPGARNYRIRQPNMKTRMAVCVSAQLPLSEPAAAVREILADQAQRAAKHGGELPEA